MTSLLDAVKLQLQKDGKPATAADSPACVALCKVMEHRFYTLSMANGDSHRRIDSLSTRVSKLEGDEA